MGLVLPEQEYSFLPGARFPSALYPAGKMGPPGPSYNRFPKPGGYLDGRRASPRVRAGAPGTGTEHGFRAKRGAGRETD